MALVLAPEAPFAEWLSELDDLIRRSPGFFVGRAVILDVTKARLTKPELVTLLADLHARDIRITGIEGADPAWLTLGMPPPISGGRATGVVEVRDGAPPEAPAEPAAPKEAACLLVDSPVRSGQSIIFPDGDVTVVGSVASGAEGPSPARWATGRPGSSAAGSRPSSWRSTASTRPRTRWRRI